MNMDEDFAYFEEGDIDQKEAKKVNNAGRKRKQDKNTEFQNANNNIKRLAKLGNATLEENIQLNNSFASLSEDQGGMKDVRSDEKSQSFESAAARMAERRANVDKIIDQYERDASKGRLRGASNASLNFFHENNVNKDVHSKQVQISDREKQIIKRLKVIPIDAQSHQFGLGGKVKATKSVLFPPSPDVSPSSTPTGIVDQTDLSDK